MKTILSAKEMTIFRSTKSEEDADGWVKGKVGIGQNVDRAEDGVNQASDGWYTDKKVSS